MSINYKITEANKNNITVRYKQGKDTLDIAMDIPVDATLEEMNSIIQAKAPLDYFKKKAVPDEVFKNLLGTGGNVHIPAPKQTAQIKPPSLRVVTFKDKV